MNHIAKALASKGRNGDTELLHVTKGEIKVLKGIAKAHGLRGLPVNPTTGLHEASFLEDFARVAAPVALGVGGFMLGGPMGGSMGASLGAGLGAAAGSKLTGGSDQDAMMWGVGGLGAGALGAAAVTAPAAVAAPAAGGVAGAGATGAAAGGATGAVTGVPATSAGGVYDTGTAFGDIAAGVYETAPTAAAAAPAAAPAVAPVAAPVVPVVPAAGGAGGAGGAAVPPPADTGAWGWMKANPVPTLMGGMALNSMLNPERGYTPTEHTTTVPGVSTSLRRRLTAPTIGPNGQTTYFENNRPSANTPTGPNRHHTQVYAKGGRVGIRGASAMDPVYLRGDGDGMSDSIPGRITNTGEPIAVADGEYVIPADAVSHFGNGSSNAGAKKLDTMVAGIRKLRTGKKKQAPAVNAAKVMRV